MAALTTDPLYMKQSDLATKLLDLYDPDAEEQRRQKALGQMQDVIGSRYARAGETGSSVEKDALSNAAKDFSLGWAERQPEQYSKAISGSQLPISNLLQGGNQDILAGSLTGYYGGNPTLARQTANENFNLNQEKLQWLKDQSTQSLWGNALGSLGQKSGLLDWLFPGGTGYGGGGTGSGAGLGGAAGGVPSLVNWLTGAKNLPDAWSKLFGGGDITNTWPNTPEWSPGISPDWSGGQDLSGVWDTWGNTPEFQPGDLSWLFPDAPAAAAPAGAGLAAAGSGLLESTGPGVAAASGAPYAFGPGVKAGGDLMSGLSSWLSGAGPWSAGIGLLSYLTNPQMSPIPAMRDTSDQDIARLAQQDAQQYMARNPAQLEELVQAAANGDPGVNGRAIEMLPSPRYDSFKARIRAAFAHTGEFAGHPSVSYPTQADQRVQEAISSMAASTGTVLTPEQYAWMYQPDTGR